jgi:hypothetical protein
MATIVEFRMRRNEADVVRPRPIAHAIAPHPTDDSVTTGDPLSAGAEIILMPLAWLKQLGRGGVRKPLKRRFAMREIVPA